MASLQDVQAWRGHKVLDPEGHKIGTVEDVYLDRETSEPEWAAVKTGLIGSNVSFVPIHGVTPTDGELRLPYTKEQVKDAPEIEVDGALSVEDEERLYEHYGRARPETAGGTPTAEGAGDA
ncbi:MAG TPA: PRC-barrel domain-containing protein [Baekduia sp.]|nr:PRC-barrel domain-containing protein [Baekduia sp.]